MRAFGWIALGWVLFVSGGATCARREPAMLYPPPPVVFESLPTLEEVASTVNRTASIESLSTNSATVEMLSTPSIPRLSATMHLQRQRNFRLRASLPIMLGSGFDMGSNDQVFWFEVPEGMSKTLYYADHQEYRQQLSRAILPVDPTWVMDAVGLVQIDPQQVVAGPIKRQDGKLEIRSARATPSGTYERVCFIDASGGYVTDQFLYNPAGVLVAQSSGSNHAYYPEQQCVLPHRLELNLVPSAGPPLQMRIDVSAYVVNQLLSGDPNLFTMPAGSQAVDLTRLGAGTPMATSGGTLSGPAAYSADASIANPIRGSTR